jgi:hypothetical protein
VQQHSEPVVPIKKPTTAGKINNVITGLEQGFKSGLQGQRYGQDPSYNDPSYGGYRGNRRRKGGLISGIIGGVIGAVEAQKHPVQDIKSGGRPTTSSSGGNGGPRAQTSGILPGAGDGSQGSGSSSQQFQPPPYEPRQ